MERFLNNLEDSLAEEQGFSTVGVALALLLSFALIFSAARVYEVESVSGDTKTWLIARRLLLRMRWENTASSPRCATRSSYRSRSLLSALWDFRLQPPARHPPPPYRKHSSKAHQKLKQARDSFSEKAISALEELKLMLPLVAAAKATT